MSLEKEQRRFSWLTVGASCVSTMLWVLAASIAVSSDNLYNFLIVGMVAVVANMVSINSARREGVVIGEARRVVRKAQEQG